MGIIPHNAKFDAEFFWTLGRSNKSKKKSIYLSLCR
jgi:hypothetical protein